MKQDRADRADVQTHVFDQTNGVVDLGTDEQARNIGESDDAHRRTVAGIAMLSTQRP